MWQEILSAVGGFAALIAALGYLFTKIAEHLLNKGLEQHKALVELNSERVKLAFSLETEGLRKLWDHIIKITTICEEFKDNDKDDDKLGEALTSLYDFRIKHYPYINPRIIALLVKLTNIIADSEEFDESKFSKIEGIKNSIIEEYHKKFILS